MRGLNILEDSCSEAMMRLTVFILNIIFCLSGMLLFGLGIYTEIEYAIFQELTKDAYAVVPIVIIVLGLIVFILSFIGIMGILRKSKLLTGLYSALLIIACLAQIAFAIGIAIKQELIEGQLDILAKQSINDWTQKGQIAKSWDILQTDLKCCGVDGYNDWSNETLSTSFIKYATKNNATADYPVPDGCCIDSSPFCGLNYSIKNGTHLNGTIYTDGCLKMTESWIKSHIPVTAGICVAIAFIQIIGIIFSCHLIRKGFSYEMLA